MNILLINPQSNIFVYKSPPLGILYIASALRQSGYSEIFVLDANADPVDRKKLEVLIRRINPRIVGVTAMAFTYKAALDILRLVKQADPGIFTVIGGVHPSGLPEECIQSEFCDCVVIGEGEETFKEICRALEGKGSLSQVQGIAFKAQGQPVFTRPRELICDLDSLAIPAFDLIDLNRYTVSFHYSLVTSARPKELILPILGSRGCCYRCVFCSNGIWDNRLRLRSPENIAGEIKHLINRYGIRRFHFFDGVFTADPERARQLCRLLLKEDLKIKWFCATRLDLVDPETLALMKEAGCELVIYGVESSAQNILDGLNKNILFSKIEAGVRLTMKAGIRCDGSFIFGAPQENQKTINTTIAFARKYFDLASFGPLVIFPNTVLAEIARRQADRKIFDRWDNFSSADLQKIIYLPVGFTFLRLRYFIYKAFILFYSHPRILGMILRKVFTSGGLFYYLKTGLRAALASRRY
jgi:radical SAM superfamily enzyme YgiQ (UPF0313 family)